MEFNILKAEEIKNHLVTKLKLQCDSKEGECRLHSFLNLLIDIFHYDNPTLEMMNNCVKNLKKIIEQDEKHILIKIMIDCWDKEIGFNTAKTKAIKKFYKRWK